MKFLAKAFLRRADAGFRAGDPRFRTVLQSAPEAIVIADGNGRIVLVNDQAAVLFGGYEAHEVEGAPIEMLLPAEVAALHRQHRARCADRRCTAPPMRARRMSGVASRRDGTSFLVEVTLSGIVTDHGTLFTAVLRDVTEQRRAEAEGAQIIRAQMAQAEAEAAHGRMAFLAEASTLLSASLDHRVTLKSVARLVVPYFADWCAIDIVAADGTIERLALAHLDPDLERFAHEWHARHPVTPDARHGVPNVIRTGRTELWGDIPEPFLDRAAESAEELDALRRLGLRSVMVVPLAARDRVLGTMTFLTAQSGRRYGDGHVALAEDLAHRVALAVENARLYTEAEAARAHAEVASRMKDEFLATVSHELRTPLTAILGWARLLRSPRFAVPPPAITPLETIERNARAQAQLVEDLLDVSRIITGSLRLDLRPTDLAAVVTAALDAVRPAAAAKRIAVDVRIDPAATAVVADAARLQQVVWNLLTNAVKFTSEDGRVWIEVTRRARHAVLAVRDTGKGIRRDFLPYIFERFRQEDSTPTRAHGGLGLGLAIVRHLVEMHGGTVRGESPGEGAGSVFTVVLPLPAETICAIPATPARPGTRARATPAQAATSDLTGCRVLVVDDEPDTRDTVAAMLAEHGATVSLASSAEEALDVLTRDRPDVLLADIGMPGLDGYDLIRRVRTLNEHAARLPAIALTAYARTEDRERALASGYDEHLVKPIEPDALASTLLGVRAR